MGTTLFEESATVYLITQVGISELRTANRMITKYFRPARARISRLCSTAISPATLLFDEQQIAKALTRPAQWKIPDDYAAARRTRETATPMVMVDSTISQTIRQMAKTAAGLLPEKNGKKASSAFCANLPSCSIADSRKGLIPGRQSLHLPPRGISCISSRCRRAGIVAAHLFARPPLRQAGLRLRHPPAGRRQLPLLLAVELLLQRVDGRRGLARRNRDLAAARRVRRQRLRGAGHRRRGRNRPAEAAARASTGCPSGPRICIRKRNRTVSSWNFSIMASNMSKDSRLYSTSGSRCA